MRTTDFGMGFFGRMPFGADARKEFSEKWSKMTDAEKLELMNKRMEAMKNREHGNHEFSVETIDQRCEEWMKKTPEEKEAFVEEKKAFMKERHEMMNHFHEHADFFGRGRGFGFGCGERGAVREAERK